MSKQKVEGEKKYQQNVFKKQWREKSVKKTVLVAKREKSAKLWKKAYRKTVLVVEGEKSKKETVLSF